MRNLIKAAALSALLLALLQIAGSARVYAAVSETEASREFKKISDELRSRQMMLAPDQYVSLLERKYGDFIKRYPKSPEAAQAHFALGRVFSSMGAHDKAAVHFEEYLKSGVSKNADQTAQVKIVLSQSYSSLERYDEAERLLREVQNSREAIDSRLQEAAKSELFRIQALRKLRIGYPAPNVSGTSHDGKNVDLEKLRGKVVLIDFWAAWCAPCRQEMPSVIKIYKDFKKRGLEIIGVSLDNDRKQFEAFVRENKMEWPQIFEGKGWASRTAQTYAVNAIPATALVDRKGILRYRNLRGPKLREAIEELLSEK